MWFHLDPTDPTPVETQLVRSLRAAVAAGLLEGGETLPTVRQLAVELRVNANAVSRAFAELERAGIVETLPDRGTVVRVPTSDPEQRARLDRLQALEDTFLREAGALGFGLDDVIIHLDSRRDRRP